MENEPVMTATKKTPGRILTTEAEMREHIRIGRAWDKVATKIVAVTYDRRRDMIRVDLSSGAILSVPRAKILGFAKAKPSQLADLEIMPGRETLWSETVDDGVLLEQLVIIAAGEPILGEIGARINGAKKSPARASASRANGLKGGRPRKKSASTPRKKAA
jgi:hypothetical protein